MTDFAESVGPRLKQVRRELGLNQPEMAAQVCVKLRAYQQYESGERLPQAESLAALSRLGINVGWLLTGVGSMHESALPQGINMDALEGAIDAVEELLGARKANLSPAKKAKLIALLYKELTMAGEARKITRDFVADLLDLAS